MSTPIDDTVRARAGEKCELCGGTGNLEVHEVQPASAAVHQDRCVLVCATCLPQLEPGAALDARHWFCLKEAIWSDVPAVQVVGYRLLTRLHAEPWAADLLGQAYLADEVLAWAKEGAGQRAEAPSAPTLDVNGAVLVDGDSVTLIKDLDVKGTTFVAKRGTLVKNIRLIPDDPDNVEGRVNKISLVLKTCFLKKSS
jgi:protein PhnA